MEKLLFIHFCTKCYPPLIDEEGRYSRTLVGDKGNSKCSHINEAKEIAS